MVDVGHFWAFQADESSLEKQRHLTSEINKRALKPLTASLYPNLLCLAPYTETCEQSFYYRAKILHLRGNTVEVNVCDYKMPNMSYVKAKPVIQICYTDYTQLWNCIQLTVVSTCVLQVFFIDFGNTAVVACSSLRELPADLLSQPFQVGVPWEAPLAWTVTYIFGQ